MKRSLPSSLITFPGVVKTGLMSSSTLAAGDEVSWLLLGLLLLGAAAARGGSAWAGTLPSAYCLSSCSQRASRSRRSWFGRRRLCGGAGVLGLQAILAWGLSQQTSLFASAPGRVRRGVSRDIMPSARDMIMRRFRDKDKTKTKHGNDRYLDAVRARLLAIAFDLAILTVHTGQYLGGFGVGWRRGDGVCR